MLSAFNFNEQMLKLRQK